MATKLNLLDPKNRLFKNIKDGNVPPWWKDIVEDPNVYIELRKGYKMDVYFNGGAIFSEVKCHKGKYSWKTHSKYLIKSEYVRNNGSIPQIKIGDACWLNEVKSNIRTHYPKSSEKGFQARLRTKLHYFLDTEFAFNDKANNRFDMIWLDIRNKKIVIVELKLTDNKELLDGSIDKQLDKYRDLIKDHNDSLQAYFSSVFDCKKSINILSEELKEIDSIKDFTIEQKPLLVIGDCTQVWIDEHKDKINDKLKDIAYGVYYYGEPSHCNLVNKSSRNRYIFNNVCE